jgi:LPXTG-site transpeptidase (sortase) family protein
MPDDKLYPVASPEAARMLGIQNDSPSVLPVEEHSQAGDPHKIEVPVYDDHQSGHGAAAQPSMWGKVAKTVIPYVVVFAVGVFLYFFFFTKVDFGSLFPAKSALPAASVQNTALLNLEKQNSSAYDAWIESYYYDVSNPAVLDPNADNSGNGLTNFQKYLLNLNPKSYDTLGLGRPDSEDLAMGISPLSGLPLTADQKQIISQYFDMETIMNKLTLDQLNSASSTPEVAGAQVFAGTTGASYGNLIPADPNAVNANDLDINTSVPGRLQIPSLKVDAPLIFSSSTEDFDTDLLNGVIHYPGTALPGQIGTTYISGHSSNYPWIKSSYNHVFTQLGDLEVNQSFDIIVTLNSGKQATLHYVVTGSQQYSPTDQAQFANSGQSVVALSTCWPVGSTSKRLVVTGELVQIDQ